jgi:hypothetical protein
MNATDTLLGRTVHALAEGLYMAGHSDRWQGETCKVLLLHTAAELIVLEQQAGRPLSLQDACRFLCRGAEEQA